MIRKGVFILFLLGTVQLKSQCAMCRAVLESEQGQKAAEGINNGIIYLMIIPYVLIGVVGFFVYKGRKKVK